VIGHEAIGMDRAVEPRGQDLQERQVEFIVATGEEAGAAVVAAARSLSRRTSAGRTSTGRTSTGRTWAGRTSTGRI
jgi:hypothetical protein